MKYLLLLLVTVMIISGCKEIRPEINIDSYITFLDLSVEQEKIITPQLVNIKNIIDEYYSTVEPENTSEPQLPYEKEIDLKVAVLDKVTPVMQNIRDQLNYEQLRFWSRSELYYFYSAARNEVADYYMDLFKLPYKRKVPYEIVSGKTNFENKQEYIDNWSIYFGKPTFPFYKKNNSRSIKSSQGGGKYRFPLGVQALISNDKLSYYEKELKDNLPENLPETPLMEIRVVLSTTDHPNFIDIENWIVYIETSDGGQLEPLHVVKRDKSWFESRDMLYTTRLPDFLKPGMQENRRSDTERNIQRNTMIQQYNSYYQLFFSEKYKGHELFSPENSYIKLIFLEEVGGRSLAEGIWVLDWSRAQD